MCSSYSGKHLDDFMNTLLTVDHFPDKKQYPYSIAEESAIFEIVRQGADPKATPFEQDAAREAADEIMEHLNLLIFSIAERYYQRLIQQWEGVSPDIRTELFDIGLRAVRNELPRYYPDAGKTYKFAGVANNAAKYAISQACEKLKLQWSRSS